MSTTKPKALRLAAILEGDYCPDSFYKRGIDKVSAEIRAQHARIAEIGAQLEAIGAGMNTQQPPALWLANEMLQAAAFPAYPPLPNAAVAQELRRQHARIAELEAKLEAVGAGGVGPLIGIAAPPTAQAEGWRPIETAPKDGALIVLGARNGVWLGKYVPVYQSGYRPENPWSSMLLNHDHMAERYTQPTHWMPLPPPPTSAEGVEHG
jgi:hypothetical protein